jgi:hypothetical protein
MQHDLWRRWLPIRAGMKNMFNLVREEVSTQGGRHVVCQNGPTDEEA